MSIMIQGFSETIIYLNGFLDIKQIGYVCKCDGRQTGSETLQRHAVTLCLRDVTATRCYVASMRRYSDTVLDPNTCSAA